LLRVEAVHAHYGHIHALNGVSLHVAEKAIVALIGANGAGKTTLLKSIIGLIRPSSGKILFEGRDIAGHIPSQVVNRGICMVPEGRQIFPHMTVQENLDMGAFMRRDAAGIADDMDMVYGLFPRLKARRRQAGGTLSGGEQQMLAMGRALMSRPRLLLLDEPSLGLAPVIVEKIMDIIISFRKEGKTVLLVEQNAVMALTTADRAYVLETGACSLEGEAKDLLTNDHVKRAYLGIT
jgi:branched-chain amino acid transport system ATP-binding protein